MAAIHRLLASVFATLLITSACAGSGIAPSPSGSAAAQGTPTSGGTVTLPIQADPTLNPWSPNAFVESIFVNRVLFDGLTKPGRDLAPAPDLATSWETSADGLAWTFRLRDGVKWSDGQPFTADDVAFNFNDIVLKKELGAQNAGNFSAVKSVAVVDAKTVRFDLSRRFAALPSFLAYNAGLVPKHILGSGDPLKNNTFNKGTPISTGPFKVEKYTAGQGVTLVRNENYFGPKPYLDKVLFTIVPDVNTQLAQALSGEISAMVLDNRAAVEKVKSSPNLKVAPRALVQYWWLALNQTDPRFRDLRVRQAFVYAIDRKAIIDSVFLGYASISNSAITPALKAYYDSSLESRYAYDVNKAKSLLAEAGWTPGADGVLTKDGKPFRFTMITDSPLFGAVSALVQQDLKKVGVVADLNTTDFTTYKNSVYVTKDYTAAVSWWVYPSDPDVFPYYHSSTAEKGFNIPGYKDQKLDDLLTQGQSAADIDGRKTVYKQLQTYMAENLPYLYLWYPQEIDVLSSSVGGVAELNLRDGMHYIGEWWLKK
jgi:peptide/nickel transport system substrate-binding protein